MLHFIYFTYKYIEYIIISQHYINLVAALFILLRYSTHTTLFNR